MKIEIDKTAVSRLMVGQGVNILQMPIWSITRMVNNGTIHSYDLITMFDYHSFINRRQVLMLRAQMMIIR